MNQIPKNLARLGSAPFKALTSGRLRGQGWLTKGFRLAPPLSAPQTVRVTKGQEVKWCACGFSGKQPLCDGSHATKGGGIKSPMSFTSPETKDYVFCTCKRSSNKPFCDGTHASLSNP